MCGIAGLLSRNEQNGDRIVRAMTDAIAHRGPDGDGIWSEPDCGLTLGHRRLAVVDLTLTGHQPMVGANGRFVISYNGEIYNHLELRDAISAAGFDWPYRGTSDTETLLAAISCFGMDDTLSRLAGMFAIALWDRQEKRLTLARDRFGEKPLYFGWAGQDFVFASELKALRAHQDFRGEMDESAVAWFVRLGYVPAPLSIHPGIFKLEPGCYLDLQAPLIARPLSSPPQPGESHAGLRIVRYWSAGKALMAGQSDCYRSDQVALSDLDEAMRVAVRRQMVADVPLGAFLSGGIDSSLIVALMQVQSDRPVRTFTIGTENPDFNEGPDAGRIARHLGTDHQELMLSDSDALAVIPRLADLYDEPFADSSQVPTHLVCAAARQHVTVALSGDSGDELFGGYNRYLWAPRLWRTFEWLPKPISRLVCKTALGLPVEWLNRAGGVVGGPRRFGEQAHKLASRLPNADSFETFFLSLISHWGTDGSSRRLPSVFPGDGQLMAGDPVIGMMAHDLGGYLPGDILCKLDRAAMGVSLETRVPFLDPSVFSVAARLPAHMRIRDGQGKWALRQLLYRHVPRNLVERPKTGFTMPFGDWLRGPLRPWAEDLLFARPLVSEILIPEDLVRTTWTQHMAGRQDLWPRLWILLMLEAWRRRWSD